MAVYEKGNETKRRLILSMFAHLKVKDVSEITVRELAAEENLSPAALYRHFESFEYLVFLGALKFFMRYMDEYFFLLQTYSEDIMKSYIKGWQLYNKYAFGRPDLFYRLFWGQHNVMFSDALDEYFELFPNTGTERFPMTGTEPYPDFYYTLLFTQDIRKRDFLMLKQAVKLGILTDDDAEYFSRSNTLMVKGMLEMYMSRNLEERRRGETECNELLVKNLERVYAYSETDI